MARRPVERVWRTVLTVVALAATVAALYLQIFERRARQEEARLAGVRLDDALAASRARLRAEILAELRQELRKESESNGARPNPQPLPDTVLRRLETSEGALEAFRPQEALVISSLGEALNTLARQTEDSDRALRRDLEELRAATLRESDIAVKTTFLMLIALAALVCQFLPDLWSREEGSR
jgi:hypothetical protein